MIEQTGRDSSDRIVQQLLNHLAAVESSPSLPRIVLLHGETGRGKTYAVQKFFDKLSAERPGYWSDVLTPPWPPNSRRQVNSLRKRVQPRSAPGSTPPPFYWLAIGSSALEGSFAVDMVPSLLEQAHRQFFTAVSIDRRLGRIGQILANLALDVFSLLLPPIDIARAVVERGVEVASLFRTDLSRSSTMRQELHASFRAVSNARSVPTPLIIIVDDASNASAESMTVLSGLISEESFQASGGEVPPESQAVFFGPHLETTVSGPLLIVCTVWSHRLKEVFGDPFQRWISELEGLGVPVDWIRCDTLTTDQARAILADWNEGVSDEAREALLSHVSTNRTVNQQVLISGIAQLEESRDPVTRELATMRGDIAVISTDPSQHVIDRLERLRETQPHGPAALRALRIASHFSWLPPKALFFQPSVTTSPTEVLEILWAQGLIGVHVSPDKPADDLLQRLSIDTDVAHFASSLPLDSLEDISLLRACEGVIVWSIKDVARDELLRSQSTSVAAIFKWIQPALDRIKSSGESEKFNSDVQVAAAIISNHPTVSGNASPLVRAFGYAKGYRVHLSSIELIDACQHFGLSEITSALAERWLTTELNSTTAEDNVIRAVLEQNRAHWEFAKALAEAHVARGEYDDAICALQVFRTTKGDAAVRSAQIANLAGDPEYALSILQECADVSSRLRSALYRQAKLLGRADLMRDVSSLSKARSRSWETNFALAIGQLGDTAQARDLLAPSAGRSVQAARALVKLLGSDSTSERQAASELQLAHPALAVEQIASLIAKGDVIQAKLLFDTTRIVPPSNWHLALQMSTVAAKLQLWDDAISLLQPFAGAHRQVDTRLSDLLRKEGRLDAALALLEGIRPQDAKTVMDSAVLLRRARHDPEAAINLLQRHAEEIPEVAVKLAKKIYDPDQPGRAHRILDVWLEKSAAASIAKADFLTREQKPTEAENVLRPWALLSPRARLNLYDLLVDMNRRREALQVLSDPRGRTRIVAQPLAAALVRDGRYEEAAKVLLPFSYDESAATQRAAALTRLGRYDEASEVLRKLRSASSPVRRLRRRIARLRKL